MPGEFNSNRSNFENKLFPQHIHQRYQALVERAYEIIEKEGGDENSKKALQTEIFQKLDHLLELINDFGKEISSSDVTILLNEVFRNDYYTSLSTIILLLQEESQILALKNHPAFKKAREDDLQYQTFLLREAALYMIDSIVHSPYRVEMSDPIVKNLQNFLNFTAEQIEVFLQYCHYTGLRQTEEINIRKEGMKLCTDLMIRLLHRKTAASPPPPPPRPQTLPHTPTTLQAKNHVAVPQNVEHTSKSSVEDDVDFGIVEIDDIYEDDDDEEEDDSLRFAPPHLIRSSSSSSTNITKTPKPNPKRVSIDLEHKSPNHSTKRREANEGVPIDHYPLPRRKVPASRPFSSCLMRKSLSSSSLTPSPTSPKTILDFTLPKGLLTLKSHPQLYTIGKFNDIVIGKFREKFKIFMKTIPTNTIQLHTSKTNPLKPCLENELLVLQSLGNYSTIFSCHGCIVEGNYFHIIYPLPMYGSLHHLILEGGGAGGSVGGSNIVRNIPIPLIIAWMYDLSDAIQFLHCHGIIHQAINAENCYLFDNLQLKLGNFQYSYSIYDDETTTTTSDQQQHHHHQQRSCSMSSSYSSSVPSVSSSISSLSIPSITTNLHNNNNNNNNNNNHQGGGISSSQSYYVSEEAEKLLPQFHIDIIGFWNTSFQLISKKSLEKVIQLQQKQNKEQLLYTSFLLNNPYILNHFPKLIPSLTTLLRATLPPSSPISTATPLPLGVSSHSNDQERGAIVMMTPKMMSSKELSEELYNILEVQFQGDPRERVNPRFKKALRNFEQSIQDLNVHMYTSSSPTSTSFNPFFPMKSMSSSSSSSSSSSPRSSHPPPAPAAASLMPSHLSSFFHFFGSNKKQRNDPQQQQQLQQSSSISPSHLSCTTNYFTDLTSSQQLRGSHSRSNDYRSVVIPSFDKERMVIDYRRELVSWLVDKVKIKVAVAEEVTIALIKNGLLIPEQIKRKHQENPKLFTEQFSGKIDSDVLEQILKYLK